MKLKTLFFTILILSVVYLIYYFIGRPEKKFGEVKVENTKSNILINKGPNLAFKTNVNLFNKNIFVYKVDRKLQNKFSIEQAKDIANILDIKNNPSTIELNNRNFYSFNKGSKNLSITEYGYIQFSYTFNETYKIFNKEIIETIIKDSNLTKVIPLPKDYKIEIEKIEADGYSSEETKYVTNFKLIPLVNKNFQYRGNKEQNLYYGSIKPITTDKTITGYSVEINAWYSLVFDTLESSTYKTISLDKTLEIIKQNPEKVFVEIGSKEIFNPIIDTNSLDITKVDIVYFVQDNLLIPYYHFQGQNEFNQNDTGVVNIYVPAI